MRGHTLFVLALLGTLVAPAVLLTTPGASASIVTPTFTVFPAPSSSTYTVAGEPSIGIDWLTGAVMFQAGAQTARVSFNLNATPPTSTWANAKPPMSIINLDPILFTDSLVGVTFAGGLDGPCSILGRSTNDGVSWSPVLNACSGTVDHETIGGGAWHTPIPSSGVLSNRSVYYCAQQPNAACAVSYDGGTTFLPPVVLGCGGLHGHVKVAPNGTAYVPNRNCGGKASVVVSTNNGLTWSARSVPSSSTPGAGFDPSVAVTKSSWVYLAYQNASGASMVALSKDEGLTWTNVTNVGASAGVVTSTFHAMVAGDDDRAAVAYLGTTTSGNAFASGFSGEWHLYVSYTYDAGGTWTTIDVTPSDPVQKGWICSAGIGCSAGRNLLDFMDASIDAKGFVYVGFADGCTGTCVTGTGASNRAWGTIARQTGGSPLFAAYDPSTAAPPLAPTLSATGGNASASLSWSVPFNNGAAITNYKVYRGATSGGETLLTTLGVVTTYTDTGLTNGATYYYKVSAVNSAGEGSASNEVNVTPAVGPSVASAPRNLTATISWANVPVVLRSVSLNWLTPTSNGGSPITSYNVYRDSGSGYALFTTATSTSTSDNTIQGGQTYSYKVTAVTSAGESPDSNVATVTIGTP